MTGAPGFCLWIAPAEDEGLVVNFMRQYLRAGQWSHGSIRVDILHRIRGFPDR